MTSFTERARIDLPIVQAGMGGGISLHELAAAVSEAGGLGTICTLPPAALQAEIAAVRRLTSRPVAVNLLLPFAGGSHFEAAAGADMVVTFWGEPKRPNDRTWLHQCGSVREAVAASAAGADGVIAQGVEAGGHVRGTIPTLELLQRVRSALPARIPVLAAGGLVDGDDVREALDAGADAVVLGTRFLLSEESRAHPEYKRRLLAAGETVRTELFGLGWPGAPHRVVPNAATRRWLRGGSRAPALIRLANGVTAPVLSRMPATLQERGKALKRPVLPLLDPVPPVEGDPERIVDSSPLYAGQGVGRIDEIRPAAELVAELAG